jgi:hypothetical protein
MQSQKTTRTTQMNEICTNTTILNDNLVTKCTQEVPNVSRYGRGNRTDNENLTNVSKITDFTLPFETKSLNYNVSLFLLNLTTSIEP